MPVVNFGIFSFGDRSIVEKVRELYPVKTKIQENASANTTGISSPHKEEGTIIPHCSS
jgi:hypothetical protein